MGRKGDRTRKKILESATHCLLHFGDRKTTFQSIADHSGLSQALIVRYLKNRENIFPAVLEYWIYWAREKTEQALLEAGTAEERLLNYLSVSRTLFHGTGEFARIYLLLHYFAGVDEKFRAINTEIKNVAVARIAKIIEDGVSDGSFKKVDAQLIAKTIHNNLVGHVLSAITETAEPYQLKLPKVLDEECLSLVKI